MYGKFFSCAFTGSMMGAGANVFAVWGYVVANTIDEFVELNPRLLAAIIGATVEDMQSAIAVLCSPDPESRSDSEEGRRLVQSGRGPFSYRVVNHGLYNGIGNEQERRDYLRGKKREERERLRQPVKSTAVNNGQPPSTMSTHTEEEEEVEEEAKEKKERERSHKRFEPPPTDAVRDFFAARGSSDHMSFLAFYDSNGWKVGKNPMKNWQAAAAGWIMRNGNGRASNVR